jgi:hypothetical protein
MKTVAGITLKAGIGMMAFWVGAWYVVHSGSAEAASLSFSGQSAQPSAEVTECPDAAALCAGQAESDDQACAARCESTNHKAGVCQSFGSRPRECWCTNDQQRWGLVSPVCSN